MNCKQLGLTAAVVALGVSAAWPFRRQIQSDPPLAEPLPQSRPFAPEANSFSLQRPDVTLQLAGEAEPSPAIDLLESEQAASPAKVSPSESSAKLETTVLPPLLPPRFEPLLPEIATSAQPRSDDRVAVRVNSGSASSGSAWSGDSAGASGDSYDDVDPRARVPWLTSGDQPFPRPPKKQRRHAISDGDTLERLAERYLGDRSRAAEIYAANREVLSDPELLPLGRVIVIPQRDVASAGDLTPVRSSPASVSPSGNHSEMTRVAPSSVPESSPHSVARPVSSSTERSERPQPAAPIGEPPPPEELPREELPPLTELAPVPGENAPLSPASETPEADPPPRIIDLPVEPL